MQNKVNQTSRLTPAEKITKLEARKQALEQRLSALKAKETAAQRKADARGKIIIGAGVLAAANDPARPAQARQWLAAALKAKLSARDLAAVAAVLTSWH